MPTILIKDAGQELSLCLVGSPGIHPIFSFTGPPLCPSSFCHLAIWGCLPSGNGQCTDLKEARVCEA